MLGSRSSSKELRAGALTPPAALLVDEALATYIDWREGERGVADAYARWTDAPRAEQPMRFAAYNAALDREEAAAKDYAESIGELARWLARHGAPDGNRQDGTTPPHADPHDRAEQRSNRGDER
jgi:hypothetical protein